jgi:hypothetical protein
MDPFERFDKFYSGDGGMFMSALPAMTDTTPQPMFPQKVSPWNFAPEVVQEGGLDSWYFTPVGGSLEKYDTKKKTYNSLNRWPKEDNPLVKYNKDGYIVAAQYLTNLSFLGEWITLTNLENPWIRNCRPTLQLGLQACNMNGPNIRMRQQQKQKQQQQQQNLIGISALRVTQLFRFFVWKRTRRRFPIYF